MWLEFLIERMTHPNNFTVRGSNPPTIEIDSLASAIYIRFKHAPVARSIDQQSPDRTIVLDLDKDGEVIGIEAVGPLDVSLNSILEAAKVQAPGIDFMDASLKASNMALA